MPMVGNKKYSYTKAGKKAAQKAAAKSGMPMRVKPGYRPAKKK